MPAFGEYFRLHFIVLIWGFTAILGKLMSISATGVVFYRTLFAATVLGLIVYFFKKKSFSVSGTQIRNMLLIGGLIAVHWILFFASARISNVSVALVGISTGAFWTSLLEPILTGRKIKPFEVLLGVFVILGIYIIFRYETGVGVGLATAVSSAVFSSLFTIFNFKLVKSHDIFTISFYEMLGAALFVAFLIPVHTYFDSTVSFSDAFALQGTDWLYLLVLVSVCTVYAYTASVELLKKFSAFVMVLTVNLEPIYGIILAFIIFGETEKMTPAFYVGATVVLLSVTGFPLLNRFQKRLEKKRAVH